MPQIDPEVGIAIAVLVEEVVDAAEEGVGEAAEAVGAEEADAGEGEVSQLWMIQYLHNYIL